MGIAKVRSYWQPYSSYPNTLIFGCLAEKLLKHYLSQLTLLLLDILPEVFLKLSFCTYSLSGKGFSLYGRTYEYLKRFEMNLFTTTLFFMNWKIFFTSLTSLFLLLVFYYIFHNYTNKVRKKEECLGFISKDFYCVSLSKI